MMTCEPISRTVGSVVILALILGTGCPRRELEPTPPEPSRSVPAPRPVLELKQLEGARDGVRQGVLASQPVPGVHARFEARTIILPSGPAVLLPSEHEAMLEVRSGAVSVASGDGPQRRTRGEMWHVGKGAKIEVTPIGELAALRAIYLVPDSK
jgi:hypothetical protein